MVFATREMGPNVRCRWVHDESYQTLGNYAYDTEDEDEELAKLESGEWVALGCIVERRCEHCGEWKASDSCYGIVIEPSDEALDTFARQCMEVA